MDELPNFIVNILQETGYSYLISSEKFQWMKSIKKLNPFYEWITCSVTKNNFVRKDELLCYHHIVKIGKLLSEEELDTRLRNYLSPEPTIYVDEVSLDSLNSVITKEKKILEQLNFLKSRLKHELDNKELKNNDAEFAEQLLNKEIENVHTVEKKYKDQLNRLDEKIVILLENLSTLQNDEAKYLCQQDLTSYRLRNANLNLYTELLKKKIFQDEKSDNSGSNIMLDDRANNVFYWLRNVEYRIGCYQAIESAADEVLKYLPECEANIDNVNYFWGKQNKYQSSQNKPVRPNKEDLLISCEFHLKDIVRGIQLNMCEQRLLKKKKNSLLLEELENIVKIRKLCNNSLYYLLMNEWITIRTSISLVKDVLNCRQNEFSEYEKRMARMKRLLISQLEENFEGFSVIYHESTFMPPLNQSHTFNLTKNVCSSITQYKTNVLSNFKNYLNVHRNIYSEIMKVDGIIFNGPTRTVRYNDDIVTILKEIYALINCQSVSIDYEVNEFKKFKESLENNYNLFHMMWYEWNKNPFNVIQAVLKLEESNEIKKRRLSILMETELSSAEFKQYKTF